MSHIPAPEAPPPQIHEIVGDLNTEAKCIVALQSPRQGHVYTLEVLRSRLTEMDALDLEVGRSPIQLYDLVKGMTRVIDFREPKRGNSKATGDEIFITHRAEPDGASNMALAGLLANCSVTSGVALRSVLGERKAATKAQPTTDAMQARIAVLESLLEAHEAAQGQPFKKSEVTTRTQQRLITSRLLPPAHMRRLVIADLLEDVGQQGKLVRFADDIRGADPVEVVANVVNAIRAVESGSATHIEQGLKFGRTILAQPGLVRVLMARSLESSGHTGKTRASKQAS